MIHSVTVTNHLGKSLKLELARPELTGLAITSITGLGPGKATINTTELATTDGSIFNMAKLAERNIVIEIYYLFKDTIEEARQISYLYFPLKKKVTLEFETDLRKVKIEGYVESNDPNIFNKKVKSQISIICPDPYFYESAINVSYFNSIGPLFEFPFENDGLDLTNAVIPSEELYPSETLYPNIYGFEPTLEFGTIVFDQISNIYYKGDAETGITIKMHALGSVTGVIKIFNITTREELDMDSDVVSVLVGSPIARGDDIIICTEAGKKSAILIRNNVTYNILSAIDRTVSTWLYLVNGDNEFAYTFDGEPSSLYFEVHNKIKYGGI